MTAKKDPADLLKAGRKTEYREQYDRMAYLACSAGGFYDKDLAKLFGVSKSTITNWKNAHPTFLTHVVKGKDEHDCMEIERSLCKIAKGFTYNETTKEPVVVKDKEGNPVVGSCGNFKTKLKTIKVVRKTVAPNERAIEFHLRNRNPERWPDSKQLDLGITKDFADHSEKIMAARNRKAERGNDENK